MNVHHDYFTIALMFDQVYYEEVAHVDWHKYNIFWVPVKDEKHHDVAFYFL